MTLRAAQRDTSTPSTATSGNSSSSTGPADSEGNNSTCDSSSSSTLAARAKAERTRYANYPVYKFKNLGNLYMNLPYCLLLTASPLLPTAGLWS